MIDPSVLESQIEPLDDLPGVISVEPLSDELLVISSGFAVWKGQRYRCALGRGGVNDPADRVEGDGSTPLGHYVLREIFYRPDRVSEDVFFSVESGTYHHEAPALPRRALRPDDGWCDDATSPLYNQWIQLPSPYGHEVLWRDDHVYDVIVVVGYNDAPAVPGKGSAIFIHLAHDTYEPTDGCVAFTREDLFSILPSLRTTTVVHVVDDA